jgi:hypothetical protein
VTIRSPPRFSEKQARSIKYQPTIDKLSFTKDVDDFQFDGTPINPAPINDLADGGFIPGTRMKQRSAVRFVAGFLRPITPDAW